MKPAPEAVFQLAQKGGLAAGDDAGASDHGHGVSFQRVLRAGDKKGALRRLCGLRLTDGSARAFLPTTARRPGALGQAVMVVAVESAGFHVFIMSGVQP
ncbi:hypothetical protein [Chromobacterium subtsugae]|uniref:hypothetical protein n=1 Tax=Chromobacterium subtsugae TaxID=251747 RepID=UPI000A574724|nr:hypothetical protein [Chromobacterium subtsugae]